MTAATGRPVTAAAPMTGPDPTATGRAGTTTTGRFARPAVTMTTGVRRGMTRTVRAAVSTSPGTTTTAVRIAMIAVRAAISLR